MTKILAAGDIHGDSRLAKKLAEKAKKEKVDVVILAGDLTFMGMETKNLIAPFKKLKKPILLLHGNHESVSTIDFLSEIYAPEARNLHGYSFTTKEVGIFGAGGIDWSGNSSFFKTLEKAYKGLKDKKLKKKIMVTHMHPFKTKAEFSGFEGSKNIRKAIEKFQPDIMLSGHIHEAEGLEEQIGKTRVIQIGKKGRIIEI